MKHFANSSFWDHYEKLPRSIQELANRNFELLKKNPQHPSLHVKKVGRYWSVRVGRGHRSLAVEIEDGLIWFWIGTHSDYDKLV
jgi:mRNA-degrading endonuclease RelE of RelBE toxin-antitoxin system